MMSFFVGIGYALEDKSGVKPQVISLPSGPGSIEGLGESFEPRLNMGTAAYSVPIQIPKGINSLQPNITLIYEGGKGNSPYGIGWDLPLDYIQRQTDKGLPRYIDSPDGVDNDGDGQIDESDELDVLIYSNGEELVPVSGGYYRCENEEAFIRFQKQGDSWIGTQKNGTRLRFGYSSEGRIQHESKRFRWYLQEIQDTNGNLIIYRYISYPDSPNMVYCREIRYALRDPLSTVFYSIVFQYEKRQDHFSDYRSTYEVCTSYRCNEIEVVVQGIPLTSCEVDDHNDDGIQDYLIRRYRLDYKLNADFSLLSKVTQYGKDGAGCLPPISFDYTSFQPESNITGSAVYMDNPPPYGFSDGDTELLDVNADGLPDLYHTASSFHSYYENLGQGHWALEAKSFENTPSSTARLSLSGTHLSDLNGDGISDLVVKAGTQSFRYYLCTGKGGYLDGQSLTFLGQIPTFPFDGNANVRLIDLDFDKNIDIMLTTSTEYQYWYNWGDGKFSNRMTGPVSLINPSLPFRFEDTRARLGDMNGDRLQDLVLVQSESICYFPSMGFGQWGEKIVMASSPYVGFRDQYLLLEDINSDGLCDLILEQTGRSGEVDYWLNLGNQSFSECRTIKGLPGYLSNTIVRIADMNGNGTADLVWSSPQADVTLRYRYLDLGNGSQPNLLRWIDNGLGRTIQIDYQSSTEYYIQARQQGVPWTTTMPFPVSVVSKTTVAMGFDLDNKPGVDSYETQYSYKNGYYDGQEKEFRGFREVEVKEIGDTTVPTKVSRYCYDTGELKESLKGKLKESSILDQQGHLFVRQNNDWQVMQLDIGINNQSIIFPWNQKSDAYLYEGTDKPVCLRTEFKYDLYGNIKEEKKYGIINHELSDTDPNYYTTGNDEILVYNEYIYDIERWILDRIKKTYTTNYYNTIQSESRYYYDQLSWGQLDKGNMTCQQDWLAEEGRYIPSIRNQYDQYGNIIRITNANEHSRTILYDLNVHIYPVSEIVEMPPDPNLILQVEYDYGYGTVRSATDFAGAVSTFDYDNFGRIEKIHKPAGSVTQYEYHLSNPISYIVSRVLEDEQGNTYDSFSYFDGLGRKLGSKIEAEQGQWRFTDAVVYNQRKLESRKWLPYYTQSNSYEKPDPNLPFISQEYDVQNRVVKTINPDQTWSSVIYKPLEQAQYDENDNAGGNTPKTMRYDGLERLVEVIERNRVNNQLEEYHTQYQWTTLGDLKQIKDAQENIKTIEYDSLRRKLFMNDPDRGHMHYRYDDAGNVKETTDAKRQVIRYSYDSAERLKTENYLDKTKDDDDPVDVTYYYDIPPIDVDLGDLTHSTGKYTGGRLSYVQDISGAEYFSYDPRGNIEWTSKHIKDLKLGVSVPYTTHYCYDLMDRITSIVYPDNDQIQYEYNRASFTEKIHGGQTGAQIITNIDYEPSGQQKTVCFGNGVLTDYSYDNRDRLDTLLTQRSDGIELIHYVYHYDPVSNIEQIIDQRPFTIVPRESPRRNTQVFQYDDLYRLTQVRYARKDDFNANYGQIDYGYDEIGNMLSKSSPLSTQSGHIDDDEHINLGTMVYSGGRFGRVGRTSGDLPGPHALTSTANGGQYNYDDNGNMVNIEGAICTWDFKDRLIRYQKGGVDAWYVYDYSDRRIAKWVTQDDQTAQTLYPNRVFEIRPYEAPTKYVFNGESRLAQIKGTLDPTRQRLHRIWLSEGMNLVCLAVQSTQTAETIFGLDAFVFVWTGTDYQRVLPYSVVEYGKPIWIYVPTSRMAVAMGSYNSNPDSIQIPAGQSLLGWPLMEPFVPSLYLQEDIRLDAFDAYTQKWWTWNTNLFFPLFISNMPQQLPSASSYWCSTENSLQMACDKTANMNILFYYCDHLGSTNVVSDIAGNLIQEITNYPYGNTREEYIPFENNQLRSNYRFTGKEKDEESDLHYFVARYYLVDIGKFINVDPLLKENTVKGNPQENSAYSYVINNPIYYIDPHGLNNYDVIKSVDTVTNQNNISDEKYRYNGILNLNDNINILSMYEKPYTPTEAMKYYIDFEHRAHAMADNTWNKMLSKSNIKSNTENLIVNTIEDITNTLIEETVRTSSKIALSEVAGVISIYQEIEWLHMNDNEKYQRILNDVRGVMFYREGDFSRMTWTIGKNQCDAFRSYMKTKYNRGPYINLLKKQ